MNDNKMKSKRKNIKNKQLLFPMVGIMVIAIIFFYWTSIVNNTEKKSAGGIKSHSALGQGQVTFISPDSSQKETILVEIAEDDYSRANGLMYREDLPENQGMLFIFEDERQQYFWMKNTPVSLDMIFVNTDNKIVNIEKYTMPYSTKSYPSRKPALYVIEVVAGYSDQHGIESSWLIDWKRY
jgi:uncharacterized membrane protein (UPF0127 family)